MNETIQSLINKLPNDWLIRVWLQIYPEDRTFSPLDVNRAVEFKSQDQRVWKIINQMKNEDPGFFLPVMPQKKTEAIQAELKSFGIHYGQRYIRMFLRGERRNADIANAAFIVSQNHQRFIELQIKKTTT